MKCSRHDSTLLSAGGGRALAAVSCVGLCALALLGTHAGPLPQGALEGV